MTDDAIHKLVKNANPVGPGASAPDAFPSRSDLLGMIQERTSNMQNTDTTTTRATPPPTPPSGTNWLRPVLVGLGIVALAVLGYGRAGFELFKFADAEAQFLGRADQEKL